MTDTHQLAQAYAALGWRVFPTIPVGVEYVDSTGVKQKSDGKPPAIPGGFRNATATPSQVTNQFTRAKARNDGEPGIGFWPGGSGMLVLDIDIKDGKQGATTLQALQDAHGELPSTLTQYTPSGGWHLFFRLPDGVKIGQAWRNPEQGRGIDVRSSNGYICLEGTTTDRGTYSFDDWTPGEGEPPEVAMAPDWLLDLIKPTTDSASTSTKPASAATQAQTTATPTAAHERHAALIKAILSGDVYHDSLRDLAASFIGQGMHPGAAVTQLRALMESSGAVRDARWLARYGQIPELVRTAGNKFTPPARDSARADFGVTATSASQTVKPQSEVILLNGSDLKPEPVRWLWPDWLALGKLHILAGAPGQGKTTIALAMAATVTIGGRWPDGSRCAPGNVLIWSGEDDPADTLLPRLIASGADRSRVYFVGGTRVGEDVRSFDPATDLPGLQAQAEAIGGVKLIIVDPIVSAVTGDSHKNAEVRRALQPVVDLASLMDAAAIGITHFSKGGKDNDPASRVVGSVAFTAVARVVLVAAKTKDDEGNERRILARGKSNIGPDDGGFEYSIEQAEPLPGIHASYAAWGKAVAGSARDLLAEPEGNTSKQDDASDAEDAVTMLKAELSTDTWVSMEVASKSLKAAGFSKKQIWSASKKLGVIRKKDGMKGPWMGQLPNPLDDFTSPAEDSHTPEDSEDSQHLKRGILESSAGIFVKMGQVESSAVADIEEF